MEYQAGRGQSRSVEGCEVLTGHVFAPRPRMLLGIHTIDDPRDAVGEGVVGLQT